MILTRTPLRVSFFGGGSDIPSYYLHSPGAVLSTTINKYMYIALCKTAYDGVKLVYNDIETVKDINQIKHSRVRESLKRFDITSNIEISSFCEIPTKGTGLGSSSTFTVGLISALKALKGQQHLTNKIADMACDIEINACGEPIGKQDQYAAAIGGLNIFKFSSNGVDFKPCSIDSKDVDKLDNNLMLFYTGVSRSASDQLKQQQENKNKNIILSQMVDQVEKAHNFLKRSDLDSFGSLLHDAWHLKKQLSYNTSSDKIDFYYDKAIKAGALGGKILGAGGGGYLLFYVPRDRQDDVAHALYDLMTFNFNLEFTGTRVVYNEAESIF